MTAGVWEELDDLNDNDIAVLVASAIEVLSTSSEPSPIEPLPALVAVVELQSELATDGIALSEAQRSELNADGPTLRALAIATLSELRNEASLAGAIEETYEARRDMMVLDPGTILSVTLLVIALRIKRIRIGETTVEFQRMRLDIIQALRALIGLH